MDGFALFRTIVSSGTALVLDEWYIDGTSFGGENP